MDSWSLNIVKLKQTGNSVSPSLWCESWDMNLMDDRSERDKENGWQEGLLRSGCSLGAVRLWPAIWLKGHMTMFGVRILNSCHYNYGCAYVLAWIQRLSLQLKVKSSIRKSRHRKWFRAEWNPGPLQPFGIWVACSTELATAVPYHPVFWGFFCKYSNYRQWFISRAL